MNEQPQTWHYGLCARYWAEHNTADGAEIENLQRRIEHYGQPVLDAGCGTGRLLIPLLKAGLDIDGCDVSGDMVSLCRLACENEGLSPNLYEQALHELDLPRTYLTIFVSGAFGIGVSREQDFLALQRFYQHLDPGGVLLLDREMPYANAREWQLWPKKNRNHLPEPWPDTMGKAPAGSARRNQWVGNGHFVGTDYELYLRVVAFNPLEQCVTRQMRTVLWRNGKVIEEEEYTLTENYYFRNELRQMLEAAGFQIEAIHNDEKVETTAENDSILFLARKPSELGA